MKSTLLRGCLLLWMAWRGTPADGVIDYLRDVKPVLRERCYACHGALQQKSNLRVDTALLLAKGGKGGPGLIPGNPSESQLWSRVKTGNRDERMPPEGEALSAEQLETIRRWIDQGAAGPADERPEPDPREHWSFQPPQRTAPPTSSRWPEGSSNPVDAFVFAELEKHGLHPGPPAGRETLIRRVTLDLTGVPPSPEEIRAFLADESPDAYERVVDRLLASPRYGQRWARHWMDIWRYADWYGRRHVPDVWNSAPQVWRWRDWIVDSLQADKGYDRMLTEMLAADEVAPEDDSARVATGYLVRNWYALNPNQWMRDLVEHTAKAFLGLTFNCAHCHDHKYDPITQRNYFELRAFFEPLQVRQDWIKGQPDPGPFEVYQYSAIRKVATNGMVSVFDERLDAKTYLYERGDERNLSADKRTADPAIPAFLGGSRWRTSPVDIPPRARAPGLQEFVRVAVLQKADDSVRLAETELQAATTTAHDALEKSLKPGGPADRIQASAARITAEAALHRRQHQLRLAEAERLAVQARIQAESSRELSPDPELRDRTARAAHVAESESSLRRAEAALAAAENALALLEAEQSVAAARRTAEGTSSGKADGEKAEAALKKARDQLAAARRQVETNQLSSSIPGDTAATATQFSPLRPTFPSTSTGRRRTLAAWMVDRGNPLTARVAVNHIWARHFHVPLVASVFDFGRNGSRPTHPELLDWLAVELMENGWRMKPLHRLLVTSRTYQMNSQGNPAGNAVDPENRWLWRMNAGQMQAEVVRDSLLQVSGGLDFSAGGPSIPNAEAETSPRRSLYFECFPEPGGNSAFAEMFDPPSSLDCYRRTTTVVPQQALVLNNSELARSCGQRLARKLSNEPSDTEFVKAAFFAILGRQPSELELDAGRIFLLERTPGDGVESARTGFARVLFNHHEFVTIR